MSPKVLTSWLLWLHVLLASAGCPARILSPHALALLQAGPRGLERGSNVHPRLP